MDSVDRSLKFRWIDLGPVRLDTVCVQTVSEPVQIRNEPLVDPQGYLHTRKRLQVEDEEASLPG